MSFNFPFVPLGNVRVFFFMYSSCLFGIWDKMKKKEKWLLNAERSQIKINYQYWRKDTQEMCDELKKAQLWEGFCRKPVREIVSPHSITVTYTHMNAAPVTLCVLLLLLLMNCFLTQYIFFSNALRSAAITLSSGSPSWMSSKMGLKGLKPRLW